MHVSVLIICIQFVAFTAAYSYLEQPKVLPGTTYPKVIVELADVMGMCTIIVHARIFSMPSHCPPPPLSTQINIAIFFSFYSVNELIL